MIVVGGESLIDLVPGPSGKDRLIHLTAHQGGSPYNCAIALAKLEQATGFLCPISRDGFGNYLLGPLHEAGVELLLKRPVAAPTSLAVVTLNEKQEARYEFYRGADRAFTAKGLIAVLPAQPRAYQVGGFCAIEPEDAAVWIQVIDEALARGATISIDPNVRPSLVADFGAYKQRLDGFLDRAHIVKLSAEDIEALQPGQSIASHAAALLSRPNCRLVVVSLGDQGSLAFTPEASGKAGIWSPPRFGDTVGAGDSLMAGTLAWLSDHDHLHPAGLLRLDTAALERMLRFAAVVAGLNCSNKGCRPPSRAEVDAVLAAG